MIGQAVVCELIDRAEFAAKFQELTGHELKQAGILAFNIITSQSGSFVETNLWKFLAETQRTHVVGYHENFLMSIVSANLTNFQIGCLDGSPTAQVVSSSYARNTEELVISLKASANSEIQTFIGLRSEVILQVLEAIR